ncbi:MAG: chemotaxis response regulator protein-glutamate methylesterase [Vicinamibacterales bacterium]
MSASSLSRKKTKVLVVDDSAIVRKMIGDALAAEPDIEVVGGAPDPYVARDLILRHKPDVVTLDIEMPRMDGLTFLRKIMEHHPLPVIIVSSLATEGSAATIEALQSGAVDVIPKPGGPYSVGQVTDRLIQRIRAIRQAPALNLKPRQRAPAAETSRITRKVTNGLIAIGASTGGTQAIESVLTRWPADLPPIVVTQHMPAAFTKSFADRLNSVCALKVVEASNGDCLDRGVVYVAPGDHHMVIERFGIQLRVRLTQGPPVHHQRPAVDVMFNSLAKVAGMPIVAMVLTGMGADGADGLVALRQAGAQTIAEAEESCVVFGMPKEAIARGGAIHVASLLKIPSLVFDCFDRMSNRQVA